MEMEPSTLHIDLGDSAQPAGTAGAAGTAGTARKAGTAEVGPAEQAGPSGPTGQAGTAGMAGSIEAVSHRTSGEPVSGPPQLPEDPLGVHIAAANEDNCGAATRV